MKARVLTIIALTLFVLTIVPSSATEGPINFVDNRPVITYENGDYFLTISEIQTTISSQAVEGWVKMRLNLQNGPLNAQWQLVVAGLTSNVKTTNTASGRYIYDAGRGVLLLFTDNSLNYFGCGFTPGTDVFIISPITATTATITEVSPEDTTEIPLTRQSGIAGNITGTWNFDLEPNTGSITFNADGTFTGIMNIVQCLD